MFGMTFIHSRQRHHYSAFPARHCTPLVAATVVTVSNAIFRHTALLAANTPKNLQFFGDPNGSCSLQDIRLVRVLSSVHLSFRIRVAQFFATFFARDAFPLAF